MEQCDIAGCLPLCCFHCNYQCQIQIVSYYIIPGLSEKQFSKKLFRYVSSFLAIQRISLNETVCQRDHKLLRQPVQLQVNIKANLGSIYAVAHSLQPQPLGKVVINGKDIKHFNKESPDAQLRMYVETSSLPGSDVSKSQVIRRQGADQAVGAIECGVRGSENSDVVSRVKSVGKATSIHYRRQLLQLRVCH